MFGIGSKKKYFSDKPQHELKEKSRILIIDDKRIDLIDDIEKEGWRVKYLEDLDKYDNTDLMDSNIVCIDILDVGKALKVENGLALAKNIKDSYPEKKIILYSSVPTHNIFNETIDVVDKRVFKDGSPYPFIEAIKELSASYYNWDNCVKEIYYKYKSSFGREIKLDDFNERMKGCISTSGDVNVDKIMKVTLSGLKIANEIKKLVSPITA